MDWFLRLLIIALLMGLGMLTKVTDNIPLWQGALAGFIAACILIGLAEWSAHNHRKREDEETLRREGM